jgi:hypothetical protein
VDDKFFEELAHKNIKDNKFHEAALVIDKFKLHDKFDLKMILNKLVDSNRIPVAKQLVENN